jgi:hypothetical protein
MPETTPGEAAPSAKGARKPFSAERSWYIFKYLHPVSAEDPKASYIAGAERAYKDAILDQADMNQLRPTLQRLLDLLETGAIERDVVRAVASGEVEL